MARTLEETLELYETAEAQILKGQAWSVDGISYTMPTLFRVQDRIREAGLPERQALRLMAGW